MKDILKATVILLFYLLQMTQHKEVPSYGHYNLLLNQFHPLVYKKAVAQRCSVEKLFLEILQNSPENTCARVSEALGLQLY